MAPSGRAVGLRQDRYLRPPHISTPLPHTAREPHPTHRRGLAHLHAQRPDLRWLQPLAHIHNLVPISAARRGMARTYPMSLDGTTPMLQFAPIQHFTWGVTLRERIGLSRRGRVLLLVRRQSGRWRHPTHGSVRPPKGVSSRLHKGPNQRPPFINAHQTDPARENTLRCSATGRGPSSPQPVSAFPEE